jgi:Cdc6-like AAA superfamily ATPase
LKEHEDKSNDELVICDFAMPGFMLFTKRWGLFDISGLMPVDYNEDAFAGLVLPPNTKKTFSSLVELQKEGSPEFDDMIAGNGVGLIILLQGPPGVGKTFTAGQSTQQIFSKETNKNNTYQRASGIFPNGRSTHWANKILVALLSIHISH